MHVQHVLHFTRGLIKRSLQETPDRNPILGQHPHHPKIIFGLGFSGMGIGLPRVALSLLIINGICRSWVQAESGYWEDAVRTGGRQESIL